MVSKISKLAGRIALDLMSFALPLLIGVVAGAYMQAAALDDVMLVRLDRQKDASGHPLCAAAALDTLGRYLGAWPQGADGACHMSAFIKYRTLSLLEGRRVEPVGDKP